MSKPPLHITADCDIKTIEERPEMDQSYITLYFNHNGREFFTMRPISENLAYNILEKVRENPST